MSFAKVYLAMPVLAAALAAACGGGRSEGDTALAGGDAGGIEVEALNYEVTADRYQRWLAAQRALDATEGLARPPALDPVRVTDAEIERAVRFLESDAGARAALARAGLSARDYVLASIALDQALVASSSARAAGGGEGRRASGSAPPAVSGGSRATERAPTATPERAARPARTQTRYRNLPPQNQEIVERHREEISRVRSRMRYRIVRERPDTVVVEAIETPPPRIVPAGTTIALRADSRVCGSTHKAGDRVTGTVAAVAGSGEATIPVGAQASLSVAGVPRAGAPMEFTLHSISVGGRSYPVAGTAVASRVERVRIGSANKDAQKVAGGAAIGAVAGQVLGRDTKSTVIGAAVGAAAGAAAAGASARYDACIPAGAPIQVTLRDALELRV